MRHIVDIHVHRSRSVSAQFEDDLAIRGDDQGNADHAQRENLPWFPEAPEQSRPQPQKVIISRMVIKAGCWLADPFQVRIVRVGRSLEARMSTGDETQDTNNLVKRMAAALGIIPWEEAEQ